MKVTALILAAGAGTRMKSDLPKVLHPLCGKPMLWHVLEVLKKVSSEEPVVVVGQGADQVLNFVKDAAVCVRQEPQLGTAHAALTAEALIKNKTDYVIITYADMPLLQSHTFERLIQTQRANSGPLTLLTVSSPDPRGFGRIEIGRAHV